MAMFLQIGKYTSPAPPTPKIYGAEWNGTSTQSWTRTDDAVNFENPTPSYKTTSGYTAGSSPFDDIMPWAGMVKSERSGGTMVAIPKFYYKWTKTGNAIKLQISPDPVEGFFVSPAHRFNATTEKDVVYIGRYHCATSTYKSTTGVQPATGVSKSSFRTFITGLGSNIYQFNFACLVTIWMLYLVEFANWDSQNSIGGGRSSSGSRMTMGYTDDMTYHTGTVGTAIGRNYYGGTQYRNIEGLWDNVYDWVDGIRFSGTDIYVNYPEECTGYYVDYRDGTKVGTRITTSGYITGFNIPGTSGFEWVIFPSGTSDSSYSYVSYVGDWSGNDSSGDALIFGGDEYKNNEGGLFSMYSGNKYYSNAANRGARLVEY